MGLPPSLGHKALREGAVYFQGTHNTGLDPSRQLTDIYQMRREARSEREAPSLFR